MAGFSIEAQSEDWHSKKPLPLFPELFVCFLFRFSNETLVSCLKKPSVLFSVLKKCLFTQYFLHDLLSILSPAPVGCCRAARGIQDGGGHTVAQGPTFCLWGGVLIPEASSKLNQHIKLFLLNVLFFLYNFQICH